MEYLESSEFGFMVEQLMKQYHIPGLSVAVVYKIGTKSVSFGMADLENNLPFTGDTIFDVASCSKSLTAASVALLVEDTNHPDVRYEAIMSKLLPEDFVMMDQGFTDGITVEDVLSHRTGMASHDNSYLGPKASKPDTPKSITRNLRNLKHAAPLRSRYLYCNQMYTVATHLIEEKSGKNFSDFLDQNLFVPLSMDSTTLQPTNARAKGWRDRMAKGYFWEGGEGDETWRGIEPQYSPEGQGAGSIMSSTNDFIKWVKALLYQEGPITGKVYHGLTKMRSIVNPHARRLKPHTTPAMYTAGMDMYFYRGAMVIGHDGNVPGFSSRFLFMPEHKFGAVVMGNSEGARSAGTTIMRMLMDEVLGVPAPERPFQARHDGKGKPKKNNKKEMKDKKKNKEIPGDGRQDPPRQDHDPAHEGETPLVPFHIYAGNYCNVGYHTLRVEMNKDGDGLFIDATDRSMGFTATLEPKKEGEEKTNGDHQTQTRRYICHLRDELELGDDAFDAEFVLDEGGEMAKRMGLDLEPAIGEMIWFERQP